VDAMGCDPGNGSAFEGHGAADGEEIFDGFVCLIRAVGEEAVIAHADTETGEHPVEKDGDCEGAPGKEEGRGEGAEVKNHHDDKGGPVCFGSNRSGTQIDAVGCLHWLSLRLLFGQRERRLQ
jgi:hypothetical protein